MSMHERFVGRVIDVNDPEKSGRVKIRIYGLHDDTTRIPDADLPWARCIFPVTNPVQSGVAGATTGMVKDSTVVGFFADQQKQVPLVEGTLGGIADDQSDFPKSDRGEDFNDVLGKHLPSVGTDALKNALDKTIGSLQFNGQGISSMLNEIGAGKIIGALDPAKGALSTFNSLKSNIAGAALDQVNGMVQGFASDLNSIATNLEGEVMQFTDIGTLVQDVQNLVGGVIPISTTLGSLEGDLVGAVSGGINLPNITDTVNHVIGSIATRTSKSAITSIDDALKRVSGSRFVMNNVMPHLESSLNNLLDIKKNG